MHLLKEKLLLLLGFIHNCGHNGAHLGLINAKQCIRIVADFVLHMVASLRLGMQVGVATQELA